MLDANLKQQLQAYLGRMTQPIEIVATLDDSDAARRNARAARGHRRAVEPDHAPAARRRRQRPRALVQRRAGVGADMGIRFAGIPMGHEFTSLVLALLQVGGHPPKVDAAVIEQIETLDGDFDFEVFISLSCQNCPDVVQALNLMAVLNPRVRATMIDGALFQAEVEAQADHGRADRAT